MAISVCCLATENDPALGYWLRSLVSSGETDLRLVFDRKVMSARDLQIWQERTEGRLPPIPLTEFPNAKKFWVENHNSAESRDLQRLSLFALNCGTPRRLDAASIKAPLIGVINVHPGRLPDYRGSSAVEWALYENQPVYVTAHFMGPDIDTGEVILEKRVDLAGAKTHADIRCATHLAAFDLMPMAIAAASCDGFSPIKVVTASDREKRSPIPNELLERALRSLA